jgi:hypothetical protein
MSAYWIDDPVDSFCAAPKCDARDQESTRAVVRYSIFKEHPAPPRVDGNRGRLRISLAPVNRLFGRRRGRRACRSGSSTRGPTDLRDALERASRGQRCEPPPLHVVAQPEDLSETVAWLNTDRAVRSPDACAHAQSAGRVPSSGPILGVMPGAVKREPRPTSQAEPRRAPPARPAGDPPAPGPKDGRPGRLAPRLGAQATRRLKALDSPGQPARSRRRPSGNAVSRP